MRRQDVLKKSSLKDLTSFFHIKSDLSNLFIKVKNLLVAFILITLLTQCNSKEKNIQGLWRTDSMTNYVNGVSFTNNTMDEHWSYFEYKPDGSVFERRGKEFRKSYYKLIGADSLAYSDSTGYILNQYQILHLDSRMLVLKKSQKPYLAGKNQELYEIRYFSKMASDSLFASQKK